MAKPKAATTIQQRFGFMDEDLRKPKHDEIMLWLTHSVGEEFQKWLNIPTSWTEEEIANHRQAATLDQERKLNKAREFLEAVEAWSDGERKNRERIKYEQEIRQLSGPVTRTEIPEKPPITTSIKWEYPIKSKNFVVGFVDMAVFYTPAYLSLSLVPVDQGFIETWKIDQYSTSEDVVYFEVKTEIPSLGDLMRQINLYRAYVEGRFFVVAPDDHHAHFLKQEGVGLIRYPQ